MSIVVISKVKEDHKLLVRKIAEDIWFENATAVSFIDIFIETESDSAPVKSIKLGTMGQVSNALDVSDFFEKISQKWKDSVATDQYKSGVLVKTRTDNFLDMSIDKIETSISRKKCNLIYESLKSRTTGNYGSTIEIIFNPPINPDQRRGVKICCLISKLSRREDSIFEASFYPYCASGLGGVNFFQDSGISTDKLVK